MCEGEGDDEGEPFQLPVEDACEAVRNRVHGARLRHHLGGPAMRAEADLYGESTRRARLHTAWHAPDSGGTRALCGADGTVMVTDDPTLVTCEVCLALVEEE
jgi:hypothetical protein